MNSWELRLLALTLLATASFGCGQSSVQQATSQTKADLPEISAFVTKPSDRFLVDVKEVSRGHPFLGINSPHPHGGAHVHFDNTKNRWPKGKDEPGNYPAIYAVVDGVVSRIDTHFTLSGGNDRYGLDLTFARDQTGSACRFCYSIEPMCPASKPGWLAVSVIWGGAISSDRSTVVARHLQADRSS